ncbi:NADPH-dependent FMN reductase (plasmid) [Agrobacterium deltaense]
MSLNLLAISASPSATSSSARLADHVLELCALDPSVRLSHLRLSELDPRALMFADDRDLGISRAVKMVADADGIILVTPIYKASFTGLLKCFLDLLPQFALVGKAVLPLATGGSLAHALALDYGLRPVLQSMGARHVVQALLILQSHMTTDDMGLLKIEAHTESMLQHAIDHFAWATRCDPETRALGHPDPIRLTAGE